MMDRLRRHYVLICLCRASPPLLDFVILPWIAPFLIELDIADTLHVGLYTGWLQTLFSLCVCIGVLPATLASDKYGRKPTILFGLVFAAVWSIVFPFVRSYPLLLLVRGLLGFSAAFVPAALKTLLVEFSDETTRPVFFATSSFGFSAGLITAPVFGGAFARPAEALPGLRGSVWDTYPYALPCIAAAGIPLLTALAGYFFMEETRPSDLVIESMRRKRSSLQVLIEKPKSRLRLPFNFATGFLSFITPRPLNILAIWFCAVLISVAYGQIEVILYYTPRESGGLGFTTREASFFLALRPLLTSVWLFTFYPRFTRAYGPERVLLFCFGWPFVLGSYIILSTLSELGIAKILLQTGLIAIFCMSALVTPMYLACEQIIAKRAPEGQLAKMCAADEILANVGGGVGAAIGPSLFAATLGKGYVVSKSVWILFMVLSSCLALACSRISDDGPLATSADSGLEEGLEGVGLLQNGGVADREAGDDEERHDVGDPQGGSEMAVRHHSAEPDDPDGDVSLSDPPRTRQAD